MRAAQLRRTRRVSVFPGHAQAVGTAVVQRAPEPEPESASPLQLPEAAYVGQWLAALVERDGPETIAHALLGAVRGEQLLKMMKILCDQRYGPEPSDEDGVRLICSVCVLAELYVTRLCCVHLLCAQGMWEGQTPTPDPGGFDIQPPAPDAGNFQLAVAFTRNGVPAQPALVYKKCWSCEPGPFRRSVDSVAAAVCESMALLHSLAADLDFKVRSVEDDEAEGEGLDADLRRAARYYMYRKWVAMKCDNIPLGKGVRIRIPLCVVECIRDHFREPGCYCVLGGPLYNCRDHGYKGHREAPDQP